MAADRKDIDWFTAMVAFGATAILLAVAPWAVDFGRDGGRWWLTVVVLVAAFVTVIVVAYGIFYLRHLRAAEDPRPQRLNE